jgi:hypothetical protein
VRFKWAQVKLMEVAKVVMASIWTRNSEDGELEMGAHRRWKQRRKKEGVEGDHGLYIAASMASRRHVAAWRSHVEQEVASGGLGNQPKLISGKHEVATRVLEKLQKCHCTRFPNYFQKF